VTALRRRLMDRFDDELEIIMTDERYGFIAGIMKEVQTTTTRTRVDISRNIDLVLTNRYLGFPIFSFSSGPCSRPPSPWAPIPWSGSMPALGVLSATSCSHLLPDGLLKGLIVDGIIAGVGSVVIFLPNILILFFFIALFEDTGYMARAAFLMDRVMHLIGLHGKSFIPMLMGFGCNVPAIMATRTLESEKDRLLTILITPFMSCSAKLPVYIILAGTFFGAAPERSSFRHLPAGHPGVHPLRAPAALHPFQGGRRSLRHGTAALPFPHAQKPADPHVGSQQAVPAKKWAVSS
jgi:ferrous iron transport protein B